MSDELGSHLERPIHFECKLNEPMHIGMRLLHTVAADHSVSISRQQVHCIFRFSLRSRTGIRPLSGVVQQPWRRDVTSPFPPSGNEGYICNRDVPYQSVTLDIRRMTDEFGSLPKGHGYCPLQLLTSRLGAATGGRVEAAAACRGRTCWIASVCSCAAGNCWAMCMSLSAFNLNNLQ